MGVVAFQRARGAELSESIEFGSQVGISWGPSVSATVKISGKVNKTWILDKDANAARMYICICVYIYACVNMYIYIYTYIDEALYRSLHSSLEVWVRDFQSLLPLEFENLLP